VKRFIFSPLILALSLGAQQSSVGTTIVDINGHRVADGPQISQSKSSSGSETTETLQSINGRMVPIERVEEHVLRDDASGRVVERVIHRYDPQGNPTTPVKQTIEEQKRADGSSSVQTTTYRGDINGRMQLIEKSVTESRKSDSSETSDTLIQRPTANGSLETVEKRNQLTVKQPNGYQAETTTLRSNGSGGFYTAVRQTAEHTQQGSQSSDKTADYEADPAGQLQLHSQSVSNTVTRADGSQDVVVDIYSRNVPGTVTASDSTLKLQERQLIQKTPGANDTVTETLSVQRPTVSDPQRLGPPRELSETVCKGDCKPRN
jgi:hypothetical protein